jgi:hypothetical protein
MMDRFCSLGQSRSHNDCERTATLPCPLAVEFDSAPGAMAGGPDGAL